MERKGVLGPTVTVCILILALSRLATAQYAGGTGQPNDPYLIYTPEQMNAIGADPNNWDKHFKLIADIDLSQYTGTQFNLIGTVSIGRRSTRAKDSFAGIFDGNGHTISNFAHIGKGEGYTGLFRYVNDPSAEIRDLGLIAPKVDAGGGSNVGALVGYLKDGTIMNCYIRGGTVSGNSRVGGLVGGIDDTGRGWRSGMIAGCCCTCDVLGGSQVGGLVGHNVGPVTNSYAAAGVVVGDVDVGGLTGKNDGTINNCYSTGRAVVGREHVGGLVGYNHYSIVNCYATSPVAGSEDVGGLVGYRRAWVDKNVEVTASFWDVETSMQATSVDGEGKTTTEMQALITFLVWGEGDSAGVWTIDEGDDYPRLAWENQTGTVVGPLEYPGLWPGTGTAGDPYQIYTVGELDRIGQYPGEWDKHYRLMADIDLASYAESDFHLIGNQEASFAGVFDGNGHTISNFTYASDEARYIGLFAYVRGKRCNPRDEGCMEQESGTIKNLGLLDPDIDGGGWGPVGALVGYLSTGTVRNCYVERGIVSTPAYWQSPTGGLVGCCAGSATIAACYASAVVVGDEGVGGLVGDSSGATITNCYAQGVVSGREAVGGLVGEYRYSSVVNCYATGSVVGLNVVGGLAGHTRSEETIASFWDIEASGQMTNAGGRGLTTAEMMTAAPFLEAGWDFVGEVENGAEDVWWIDEGRDYPRLWWEGAEPQF